MAPLEIQRLIELRSNLDLTIWRKFVWPPIWRKFVFGASVPNAIIKFKSKLCGNTCVVLNRPVCNRG